MIVAALETIVAGLPWQVGSPAPGVAAPKASSARERGERRQRARR